MARSGRSSGGSSAIAGGARLNSRGPVSFGGPERGGIRSGPPSRAEYTQARGILEAATRAGFITSRIGIGESIRQQGPQLSSGIGATRVPGIEARLGVPLRPISIPGGSGSGESPTTAPINTGRLEGIRYIPAPPRPGSASRFEPFRPSHTEPTREGPANAGNIIRNSVVFSTTLQQRDVPSPQNAPLARTEASGDQNRRFVTPTLNNLAVQSRRTSERTLSGRVPHVGRESVRILPDIRRQAPINPDNVPPVNPTRLAPNTGDLPRPPETARAQNIADAITHVQGQLQELLVTGTSKAEQRPAGISVVKPAIAVGSQITLQQEFAAAISQKGKSLTPSGEAKRQSVMREAKRAGLIIPVEKNGILNKVKTNVQSYLEEITIRPLRSWSYIQGGWREVSYALSGKRSSNGADELSYAPRLVLVNGSYIIPQPLEVVPVEEDEITKRKRKTKKEIKDKKSLQVRLRERFSAIKLLLTHPYEVPTVAPSIVPLPQTETQTKLDTQTKIQPQLQLATKSDTELQTMHKIAVNVDVRSRPVPSEQPLLRLVPSSAKDEKDVKLPKDQGKEKNVEPVTIFETKKRKDINYVIDKKTKRERVEQVFEGARIAAERFGDLISGLIVALHAPKFTEASKSPLVRPFRKRQDGSELIFWKHIVSMGALPQKAWKKMAEWLVEKFRPVAIKENKALDDREAHMDDVKLVWDDTIKPDVPIAA